MLCNMRGKLAKPSYVEGLNNWAKCVTPEGGFLVISRLCPTVSEKHHSRLDKAMQSDYAQVTRHEIARTSM